MDLLPENDEEAFVNYEEQVIYQVQSLLHEKEGLENKAVLEVSARLEELIYVQTLKHFSLSTTAHVWTKRDYIQYYQEQTQKLISNLKTKMMNWKKVFEDNEKNPTNLLKQFMKEGDGKRKAAVNRPVKSQNEGGDSVTGGTAKPKAPKVPRAKAEGKSGGGPKGGKKKGAAQATTLTLEGSLDDMFADPMADPFDDALFSNGDVELFDENALEMDDLFKFGSGDDPLKF